MKSFPRLITVLVLLCAQRNAFSQTTDAFPCGDNDKDCAAKAQREHAVKTLEFWKDSLAKPVTQRIGTAPSALVEFLKLDVIRHGIPNKPHSGTVTAGFLRDVRTAIEELPAPVKTLLASKLAGVFFIDDIGGTGFTDEILDADKNPVAGFVVLDPAVLSARRANAWAAWKENTPFDARPGIKLTATLETERENNRKNAIQYILLHEFGHVVSIGGNLHPSWTIDPQDVPTTVNYPFFSLSWMVSHVDDKYVTRFDDVFPQRRNVVYYFGAKLGAEEMVKTYTNLEKTNFPTLYAATNPGDDFAEAFASYVHTVLMHKPFGIRIYAEGELKKTYASCWKQARCAEKEKILETLLTTQ